MSRKRCFQQQFTEIFKQIGLHFIENAERLGNAVGDNTSSIDIFVSLNPSELVTVDISHKECLVKRSGFKAMSVDVKVDGLVEKLKEKMEELTNE